MDQHVPRAITVGLRLRGVDVITAFEDGAGTINDSQLLSRASELGRVLFTQDDDLLAEAAERQRASILFTGVIYAHQLRTSIGTCVNDLELIAKTAEPEDLLNTVVFLPLMARLFQWQADFCPCSSGINRAVSCQSKTKRSRKAPLLFRLLRFSAKAGKVLCRLPYNLQPGVPTPPYSTNETFR